jgi:hypothetical protein
MVMSTIHVLNITPAIFHSMKPRALRRHTLAHRECIYDVDVLDATIASLVVRDTGELGFAAKPSNGPRRNACQLDEKAWLCAQPGVEGKNSPLTLHY